MRISSILMLFLVGCVTIPLSETPETLPILIYQSPLPAVSRPSYYSDLRLDLKLYIAKDSSVTKAYFLTSSGDRDWDDRALTEIRKWKFVPATLEGKPVPIWVRQAVVVRFQDPVKMYLAEIVCPDRTSADSAYALLEAGRDFGQTSRDVSVSASRAIDGLRGEIDIRTLPYHIQQELEKLDEGEYTPPLQFGQKFVIFRRLAPHGGSPS